jgi:hypothetical protein
MSKKTVKEIAEIYGVTRTGVYYWIENGLPYEVEKVIGIKPRKVIDTDEVDKFLQVGRKEVK